LPEEVAADFAGGSVADAREPLGPEDYDLIVSEKPAFWEEAMRLAGIKGQDGGNPLRVHGGAIWSFGDSFLEHEDPFSKGPGMSNNALLVDTSRPEPVVRYLVDEAGRARHIVEFAGDETWEKNRIWPGAGISLKGYLYLYFEIVDINESAAGAPAGAGLARAAATAVGGDLAFARVGRVPVSPHSVVLGRSREIYLYGIRKVGWDSWVTLHRVSAGGIEHAEAYELLDDSLVEGVHGQVSVTWSGFLERYIMLHVGNPFDEPQHFYLRIASSPDGPFSEPRLIAHIPREAGEGWDGLYYAAYWHPEIFREGGRVLVFTHCVHGEPVPHLVEVELVERRR